MSKKEDRYAEFFMTDRLTKTQQRELASHFTRETFAPMSYASGCPVCSHILKPQIEEMLYHKVPMEFINRYLYVLGYPKEPVAAFKRHLREHCAVAKAASQVSMANYLKRVTEDVTERLSGEGVLDAMLVSYAENHDPDEDPVSNREAIAAVKAKHQMTQGKDDRRMFVELYERVEAAKIAAAALGSYIEGGDVVDAELVEGEDDLAEDLDDFL
jgi:hypothetical protein